jgi:site-specific DNA-methyltransferase (adenine-specific)
MVHRSENNARLDITRHDTFNAFGLNSVAVYVFHLAHAPAVGTELDSTAFSTYFSEFVANLSADAVVAFISDTRSALTLVPVLTEHMTFRLWIAVERESSLSHAGFLPDNHAALTIFTKHNSAFKHNKIRIEYTLCPACHKTSKDYGGKKHLYDPYGTLMSDVWRDIKLPHHGYPAQIIERLADLFALPPLTGLHYFNLNDNAPLYTPVPEQAPTPSAVVSPPKLDSALYIGDCLDVLAQLPENSVDFIFADPPYNIKKKYDNWDDGIQIEEYFSWCDRWIAALHRVLKPGGVFCLLNIPLWVVRHYLFARDLFTYVDYIVWEGLGLPVRNIMPAHYGLLCLAKGEFSGLANYANALTPDSLENAGLSLKAWYCARQTCIKKRNSLGITDKMPLTNLWWDIHRLKHNSKRVDHPCQLPPELMKRLIHSFSRPGEIVLDPFNGAGTTTLVADLMHRRYIGIELSEKYHAIANQRHEEIRQGLDPFRKTTSSASQAKNSRVKRLEKQDYKVSKKLLQLEVKALAASLGRKPSREDVKQHSKYPFEYFEKYFIDWGEVCAAVGNKGMNEDLIYEQTQQEQWEQLKLLEKKERYKTR